MLEQVVTVGPEYWADLFTGLVLLCVVIVGAVSWL